MEKQNMASNQNKFNKQSNHSSDTKKMDMQVYTCKAYYHKDATSKSYTYKRKF